jgi:hypothetical protein
MRKKNKLILAILLNAIWLLILAVYLPVYAAEPKEKDAIKILTFTTDHRYFITARPTFIVVVHNDTTDPIVPRGVIEIVDPEGIVQSHTITLNDELALLSPGQEFSYQLGWNDKAVSSIFPPLGKYHAKLIVYDAFDTEVSSVSESEFVVIPLQYVGAVLIFGDIFVLGIAYLAIKWVKNKRRKPAQRTVVIFKPSKKKIP